MVQVSKNAYIHVNIYLIIKRFNCVGSLSKRLSKKVDRLKCSSLREKAANFLAQRSAT